MSDTTVRVPDTAEGIWVNAENVAPRRRVRGLRFPEFAGTAVAQIAGGIATLAGTYVQWGIGATLIVGGAAAVVLGMLREAGKI